MTGKFFHGLLTLFVLHPVSFLPSCFGSRCYRICSHRDLTLDLSICVMKLDVSTQYSMFLEASLSWQYTYHTYTWLRTTKIYLIKMHINVSQLLLYWIPNIPVATPTPEQRLGRKDLAVFRLGLKYLMLGKSPKLHGHENTSLNPPNTLRAVKRDLHWFHGNPISASHPLILEHTRCSLCGEM